MANGGKSIKVVIADDHLCFGQALQVVLEKERDLSVLEVVTDGASALEVALSRKPDVILIGLDMPGIDGVEVTKRLRQIDAAVTVVILSSDADPLSLARAVQAGARGMIPKTEPVARITEAVRMAYRGEPLHTSKEVEDSFRLLRRHRARNGNLEDRLERLTPRELEILQLMAEGVTPDDISERLGMSRHTLRTHTQNVLTKLGMHTKLDAIVAAIRFGKIQTVNIATEEDLEAEPV